MATFTQHKFSGAGAPSTTPARVGDHFTDTTNDNAYISVGTSSSADWVLVGGSAGDSFGTINTDAGTNPEADSPSDTLNMTSTDSSVTVTGVSATDTVDLTVDHTNIANIGTNTHAQIDTHIADGDIHVDHTAVNVNTAANSGLTGGGDISASRSLEVDPNNATSATIATGDEILFGDVDDSNNLKKTTVSDLLSNAASTLQDAYDNSSDGEIVLDATRTSLELRDAATPIGSNLLEVLDNGSSTTYFAVPAGSPTAPDTGTRSERFGASASAAFTDATAIGNGATCSQLEATSIGSASSAANSGTSVGYSSAALANGVSIGDSATNTGTSSVAVGAAATSAGTATAVGASSSGSGSSSVAIGNTSSATTFFSTAVGASSSSSGLASFAMGFLAVASNQSAVAVGNIANSSGLNSSSLGTASTCSGDNSVAVGPGSIVSHDNSFSFRGDSTADNQVIFGGDGTDQEVTTFYVGNGVVVSTPTSNVDFHVTGGSGTDISATNLRINGGQGTGTGAGGSIIFRTAPTGSTGSSLNALETRVTIVDSGETFFGNGESDASPVTEADISGTAGSGTDVAATDLRINGGQGTGTGAGGDIIFRTATPGTTGTSLNSLSTRYTITDDGENIFGSCIHKPIENTAVDITLDETNYAVTVDASGANRTITLPAISGITGRVYVVKKTDSSVNTVTVDGNASETIDGATTNVLSSQYDSITIIAGASEWHII